MDNKEPQFYRVGAVIVSEGRLLLVTNSESRVWWTPGGRVEENEDNVEALRRELREELGVEASSVHFFLSLESHHSVESDSMRSYGYYRVELAGNPVATSEIAHIRWATAAEIRTDEVTATDTVANVIVPRLIKDGILQG